MLKKCDKYHGWTFQEIHTLQTQLEAAKYDVIKYCIGEALWPNEWNSVFSSFTNIWG